MPKRTELGDDPHLLSSSATKKAINWTDDQSGTRTYSLFAHLDATIARCNDPEQDPEEPVSRAAPKVVQRVEEEANSKDKPS